MAQRATDNDGGPAQLQRLYLEQLSDIHAAELQACKLFPDMAAVATDDDVTSVIRAAASETEVQLARLDALLDELGIELDTSSGAAPVELQDELLRLLDRSQEHTPDRDALVLQSARRSLRSQISGYESACATARRLGDFRTLDILLLSLDEELATDSSLSDIVARRSRLLRAI